MKSASTVGLRPNSLTTSFDSASSYAIQTFVAQNTSLPSCCIPYFDIGSLTDGFKSLKQSTGLLYDSTTATLSTNVLSSLSLTTTGIDNDVAILRTGNVGILTSVAPILPFEISFDGANDGIKQRIAGPFSYPTFGLKIGGYIGPGGADHIIQTSSNLHIDSASPNSIYLNFFNTLGSTYVRNFVAISDERTKTEIIKIEYPTQYDEVFENMKRIGAYHYKYADIYTQPKSSQYGWLAQEVQKVFPEYITKQRDCIPNMMDNIDFTYTEQDDGYSFIITCDADNFSLDIDKQYKFYAFTSDVEFDYIENVSLVDNNTFFYKTENKQREYIKLILVGEYVDDRMALSKEKLTQLNWCGTLGLIDKVREQEAQILLLTDKLDKLLLNLNISI